MGYAALIVGSALTLITGWCVAAWVASILEKVLATLVVAVTQVVLTLMLAGYVLESFATTTVLAVNLVVTGAALTLTGRALSLGDRVRGSWATARGLRPGAGLVGNAWAWILGAIVAVSTLYLALAAYVLPPASWDTLTYHLVMVAEWLRADRIVMSPLSVLANSSPLNGELTFLWVGALTRSDVLTELPQLGFAALGAVAVVAMARTVGVSRPGAVVAGCLYFTTPVVLLQASTTYVDLVLPGLFLAGYAFLLRFVMTDDATASRPVTTLALAGIACGLAAGSKSIGIVYAVVAAVVLGVNLVWRQRRDDVPWRSVVGWFAIFIVPIIALGSFWYVRTWIEYGNPTYPYQVEYAGVTVFDGTPYDEITFPPEVLADVPASLRTLVSWTKLGNARGFAPLTGGLGPQWLFLELPTLVVFSVWLGFRRRRLLLTFVLPFVVMLIATPASWWSRFTIAFVAPGAIAVPFVIERIRARTAVTLLKLATVVIVVVGCVRSSERLMLGGTIFSADEVLARVADPPRERTLGQLVLPEYAWTDTIPKDSRIGIRPDDQPAFFTFPWIYQLFGPDFRNEVVALSDHDVAPAALVATLRTRAIDYLVTYPGTETRDVARAHPEALELVSSVGDVEVYRVKPAPSREQDPAS